MNKLNRRHIKYDGDILPNTLIWRYMNFAKFIDFLITKSLWFSKIDRFNDEKEGYLELNNFHKYCYLKAEGDDYSLKFTDSFDEQDDDIDFSDFIKQMYEKTRKNIKNIYVNSWHISDVENELMWLAYGEDKNSVAIRCEFQSLLNFFQSEEYYNFDIRAINYYDHKEIRFELLDRLAPAFTKRKRFKSENELRLIAYRFEGIDQDNDNYKVIEDENGKVLSGIKIDLDFDNSKYEVVVSPYSEEWFAELIMEIGKKYQFDVVLSER